MIEKHIRTDLGVGARTVTNGFKVDISRGERIGRVSSEWFSRPDDERYLSLGALHEALRTRAERATARTVETRAVRGYCQVNLPGSQKPFPQPGVHAAVVAAAHV
jgi:hypothetical protein